MATTLSIRCALAALAAGAALIAIPGSASAAFPGANGLIASSLCEDGAGCAADHIWTIDPATGAEKRVTSGPATDLDPSFSPDGKQIVFTRCPVAGNCRVAVVPTSGGSVEELTIGAATDGQPSYSPDGRQIVFKRSDANGSQLVVMNADGSNQTPITSGPRREYDPAWSPDGSEIAYSSCGLLDCRVNVVSPGGGVPTPLTTAGDDNSHPAWSPDGSHIAFLHNDYVKLETDVWVMDAHGGDQHALTHTAKSAGAYFQAYSPDGSKIVYAQYDGGANEPLFVMNADGSDPHLLTGAAEYHQMVDWQSTLPAPPASPAPAAKLSVPARCSDRIAGSSKRDRLRGTAVGDLIDGLAGNDVIRGGAGDDCLNGGKGADRITGGKGADRITGGPGRDTLNLVDGRRDVANCGLGADTVRADAQDLLRRCERVTRVKRRS
jgi:Tol biopolymer transport system component